MCDGLYFDRNGRGRIDGLVTDFFLHRQTDAIDPRDGMLTESGMTREKEED